MNLTANLTLDADLRYVSTLPNPEVHAYEELNARLRWHLSKQWDAALSGRNLLHAHHQEFTAPISDAISRSVMLDARWKFRQLRFNVERTRVVQASSGSVAGDRDIESRGSSSAAAF
jgi:hypothetical protein